MELRPIPKGDMEHWYETEFSEAFPPVERKPMEEFTRMIERGRYEVLGLYEGDEMLGYATLWTCPEYPWAVLLDYLGVTASRRNGGLGAEILRLLGERHAGQALIIESELPVPGDSEEDNHLRQRRMGFYRRNGFTPVYSMAACGVALQTMVRGREVELDALMDAHRAIYGPERPDAQVPLQEGASPELPYWMKG